MAHYMTNSNIPVKHERRKYYCGALDDLSTRRDNGLMRNLRHIRKARGLSQAELAEAASCSQGLISRLETGGKNITLDQIENIARALKCEAWELFGIDETRLQLLDAINSASPDRRRALLTLLQSGG